MERSNWIMIWHPWAHPSMSHSKTCFMRKTVEAAFSSFSIYAGGSFQFPRHWRTLGNNPSKSVIPNSYKRGKRENWICSEIHKKWRSIGFAASQKVWHFYVKLTYCAPAFCKIAFGWDLKRIPHEIHTQSIRELLPSIQQKVTPLVSHKDEELATQSRSGP